MQLLLCKLNCLMILASDVNFGWVTSVSILRAEAVHLRKERWKVDGCASRRLDELDIFAMTAAHKLMQRKLNSCGVDNATEL